MNESLRILGKIRGYSYLIFIFDLLLLIHKNIADFFHTTDEKILYGLIAILFIQITFCVLWIIKYVFVVQSDEQVKTLTMYAARVRIYLLVMYMDLILLIINSVIVRSYTFDKLLVIMLILMLVAVLRGITILHRRDFPALAPEDQNKELSRVGANKKNKKRKTHK